MVVCLQGWWTFHKPLPYDKVSSAPSLNLSCQETDLGRPQQWHYARSRLDWRRLLLSLGALRIPCEKSRLLSWKERPWRGALMSLIHEWGRHLGRPAELSLRCSSTCSRTATRERFQEEDNKFLFKAIKFILTNAHPKITETEVLTTRE